MSFSAGSLAEHVFIRQDAVKDLGSLKPCKKYFTEDDVQSFLCIARVHSHTQVWTGAFKYHLTAEERENGKFRCSWNDGNMSKILRRSGCFIGLMRNYTQRKLSIGLNVLPINQSFKGTTWSPQCSCQTVQKAPHIPRTIVL